MYLVKNSQKENLDNFTKAYLEENKYKYSVDYGYYVWDKVESGLYYVFLIKQVGEDSYFYYLSNNEEELFKNLFKRIKSSGLKLKKIRNDELKSVFHQDAILIKSNMKKNIEISVKQSKSDTKTKYDFSDEAQAKFDAQEGKYEGLKVKKRKTISENKNVTMDNEATIFQPQEQNEIRTIQSNVDSFQIPFSELKGRVVHIPKGTIIESVLQSAISSQSVLENDIITAVFEQDWMYDGALIAPAGSILYGKVIDAQKAGYAYGNGLIKIKFTEVLTMDGQRFTLSDNIVELSTGINRSVKVTSRVIGGAIMGVMAGTLYALISGGDVASGVAWGASVGGAGGAVNATLQKGQDVEIPTGTRLQIKLVEPMSVTPIY